MLNIKELLNEMTLQEKASLCSGKGFWYTKDIERLNIPSISMNDGPHGLRKPEDETGSLGESTPSTCFPTYSALGSSWDTSLIHLVGEAIANEALSSGASILLGPGINIKRSPLCGRNFEYISEDPYLSGKMGAAFIDGVQSKGVGTSLKHFAVNNQESRRMLIHVVIDERALREIYLAGFEIAVKESNPWTVMAAYNKLSGTYCSESRKLLTDILRDEWGFNGIVVTDWGACNDRVEGLEAGQDLQMPENQNNDAKIVEALKNGKLNVSLLDKTVERILGVIEKSINNKKDDFKFDIEEHHQLARRACAESTVLLKNNGILPLNKNVKIALIGELAEKPHFQGGGSSKINPTKIETPYKAFAEKGAVYARGYNTRKGNTTKALLGEAAQAAKDSDVAIVFAGYTDAIETEGLDKEHLSLPEYMNEIILTASKANPNTIVVLQNGSPISMPWLNNVKAVLECYLSGQASGAAIYDIITGKINPSGKLAETFPIKITDTPAHKWFPGNMRTVEYRESIYVGYRYYDTANKDVLFPFGYGLSYTLFEYGNLQLSSEKITSEDELEVTLEVKNTGKVRGAEIVQLYVADDKSTVFRPAKELKAFKKIWLDAGEKQSISFTLDKRSFAYYNTNIKDWHVETGSFAILIGASSADIRLRKELFIQSDDVDIPNDTLKLQDYYELKGNPLDFSDESFSALLGYEIPESKYEIRRPFDANCTLIDLRQVFIGRLLHRIFIFITKRMSTSEFESTEALVKQVEELPLRGIGALSGMISAVQIEGILLVVNGSFFKGIGKIIRNK